MLSQISLQGINSESDVEQKIIYPLLTAAHPHGLGIRPENIVTKKNIRKFDIGKGTEKKSYFPDYLLVREGFPLCVIEAKEPGTDLTAAYREARLYANELNALFERDVNPVSIVAAANDKEIWVGHPTVAHPDKVVPTSDLDPHSTGLSQLQALVNETTLGKMLANLKLKTKGGRKYRPKALLGGPAISDEAMPRNSFGATLADELRYIFQPETRADRAKVVKEAYVSSGNRSRYLKPIDKIIRASVPSSLSSPRLVKDTIRPKEVVAAFSKERRDLEHQVMLVIGGVGAGKSTFVDYVEEVAIDPELKAKTLWVHINMNDAPGSANEIYNWLRQQIIQSIQRLHPEADFDDLDTLRSLYAVEINAFNKNVGKLYQATPGLYEHKLADEIQRLRSDLQVTSTCYCRYCGGEKGKLVIIVLDNCDKRTRDEQLLMFQAAQWIKTTFRSLVILPLREETYDHHQNEPPLDTALKDLVFRIEPPDFYEVLIKRVQMALDETAASAPKSLRYSLPNSMHVDYASNEQGRYLAAIVASIFVNDRTVSRLLMGLAGRNIRRAFELFLEICNSGHIPESEIVKITTSSGAHNIPLHVIMRVLLRRNKRFFSNKDAYVKNIIQSELFPDAAMGFGRLLILSWLKSRASKLGPTKLEGYFRLSDLIDELAKIGIEEETALREAEFLVKAHCILTEDFRSDLSVATLVKIGPAGVVHLDLLTDANYWAAIAEDSAFTQEGIARGIAERLADAEKQFSLSATVSNAWDCLKYFEQQYARWSTNVSFLDGVDKENMPNLERAQKSIEQFAEQTPLGVWFKATDELKVGSQHSVTLARKIPTGFFIDFAPRVSGLLLLKDIPADLRPTIAEGEKVRVTICGVEPMKRKIHLAFAGLEI